MTASTVLRPRHVVVALSRQLGVAASVAVVAPFKVGPETGFTSQIGSAVAPIVGEVINDSDLDLVFSIEQSSDNAVADPYAAINMRIGGAAVASVTVKPRGRVQFAVETVTKAFIQVKSTGGGWGRAIVCHFVGHLNRLERADG